MGRSFVLARFHSFYVNRFWFLVDKVDLPPGAERIHITGSFNYWTPDERWLMRLERPGRWVLDVSPGRVEAPGNSGYPEYQLLVDGSTVLGADFFPEEPRAGNNFLIIPAEDEGVWQHRINELTRPKPQTLPDEAWMTNFREVRGGQIRSGRLYRSSHPFLTCLLDEREARRQALVQQLWREHGIQAVINLADGEAVIFDPSCPRSYTLAARDGQVLFLPMEYNTVYYHSRGSLFQSQIGKMLEFMVRTQGPWVIHCRLGIDRTGVAVAILQGLCGASWETIAEDFSQTAVFSPKEYRHPELLAYTLRRLIGQDPRHSEDLSRDLVQALSRSVRNQDFLKQLIQKLTSP